jgi:carbamoyl-phosphate synthase large subunit
MIAKTIMVFGAGTLQLSIIAKCKKEGVITIVVDPDENAVGKSQADFFYQVNGDDFKRTCELIDLHNVQGIITAATDKPLVVMSEIAELYKFPFFSKHTAEVTTDKSRMKSIFINSGIPCAAGYMISQVKEITNYPVIIKPIDSSGSRGVFHCSNVKEAKQFLTEAKQFSKTDAVLCEEVLYGDEYSVEAIHYENRTHLIQITEKHTTDFPFNVELAHIAPASIDSKTYSKIKELIEEIASAFDYKNCASHTELKVENDTIKVIETSPRLGGDKITSDLVPLSTGVDIEKLLIKISLGEIPEIETSKSSFAGIFYFDFGFGMWSKHDKNESFSISGLEHFENSLTNGQKIPVITNSIDRYGHVVLTAESKVDLIRKKNLIFKELNTNITK